MPYTQDEINAGQKRINYELNHVDKRVIWTLKDVIGILKTVVALPPIAAQLHGVDFSPLEVALDDAYKASKEVADIIPPGCQGPYPN